MMMNKPLLEFSEINFNMLSYRKRIIDGMNIIFCSATIDFEFKINHEPLLVDLQLKILNIRINMIGL